MSKSIRTLTTAIMMLAAAISTPSSSLVDEKVLIGAYDPSQINGLVFIANEQNIFGLRFFVYRQGGEIEDNPADVEFGPYAPNGSYAKLDWRSKLPSLNDKKSVTLRWSRIDKTTVIGQISAPAGLRVAIETYRPWGESISDSVWATFGTPDDRRSIIGEQVHIQKNSSALRRFFLRADRAANGAVSYEDGAAMRKALIAEGRAKQTDQSERSGVYRHAALSFDFDQTASVGFVAMVGDNFDVMEQEANKVLQKPLTEQLDLAQKNYAATRTAGSGAIGDSFEAINRSINWNRYYYPDKQQEYIALHRLPGRSDRDSKEGPALSWDTFFTAALAGMVDEASAASTIRALLDGQTPDGRIPLRRYLQNTPRTEPGVLSGRSMPPVGALCVWKVYLATNDLDLLAWAYPRLVQWNEWWFKDRGDGARWRDGNGDGMLEWGFDAEVERGSIGVRMLSNSAKLRLAFSESGLENRPQWGNGLGGNGEDINSAAANPAKTKSDEVLYNDQAHTIDLTSVALNSLYALDTEMLVMMARELGLAAEAEKHRVRYDRIKDSINKNLWSEDDGLYLNRRWDGRFSRRLSLENFYPLIAGIPDEDRAKLMLKTLRNDKKFWGERILASIARDDPDFAADGTGRGSVWSVMNYLVYQGLRRYGFHDEATALAQKSVSLGRSAWEKGGRLCDSFSSVDGRPVNDDPALKTTFAGLIYWPGFEEMIYADPWAGISFGSIAVTEESKIERLKFSDASFDLILSPKLTEIRRGGELEIECEGAAQIRGYRANEHAVSFMLETKERVRLQVPAMEGRKITVSVDEKVLGSTSAGAAASFRVPAGSHRVFIVK